METINPALLITLIKTALRYVNFLLQGVKPINIKHIFPRCGHLITCWPWPSGPSSRSGPRYDEGDQRLLYGMRGSISVLFMIAPEKIFYRD